MFVQKNPTLRGIWSFSWMHIMWISIWVTAAVALFQLTKWDWLVVPALPLTITGTAVAFYVGFKNNQAYDRLWEARKIWGAIVNSSRAWGSAVKAFVTDVFADAHSDTASIESHQKELIYRHIAWLYALRKQLLIPTAWEHISQGKRVAKLAEQRMQRTGVGLVDDSTMEEILAQFTPAHEARQIIGTKNKATQLIDAQAQHLAKLRAAGLTDDFRHMELQKILYDFYVHQGKAERIKKFPLPRQYGGMSYVFVGIFIFLLPFGMASQFAKLGPDAAWYSIPFSGLVCWIYLMMELVGDYSENPFEGLGNDIPMMSLCRVIEIDLREMLGETDLPPNIEAKNGVLM